jgi:hypothetical protein
MLSRAPRKRTRSRSLRQWRREDARAKEVAEQAGLKVRSESAPQATAEEKQEKLESIGKNATDTGGRLPRLPVGARVLVKVAAKDAYTKITQMLQAAELCKEAPERLVMLWMEMSKRIRAAGLGEDEVKAAVAEVSGAEACVKLCIKANDDDLTAWAERLSKEYLTTEHTATLSGRLYEARREPTETALKFLTRMAPLGRAMALMGVLQESAVLAALWRKETLGKPYCQANSTYFEPIKSKVQDGKIGDID